jgi:hypothetical protein
MDPQNCGSARNEKGMFTTTYPGKADTMNAAQMQSLDKEAWRNVEIKRAAYETEPFFEPTRGGSAPMFIDRVVGRTRQEVEIKIAALLQSRATMKEYLSLKYVENDMHGVQDAASDIRDIDAELVGLRWVLGD